MSEYVHPEVLVTTDWVHANLGKPGVGLVEVDVAEADLGHPELLQYEQQKYDRDEPCDEDPEEGPKQRVDAVGARLHGHTGLDVVAGAVPMVDGILAVDKRRHGNECNQHNAMANKEVTRWKPEYFSGQAAGVER